MVMTNSEGTLCPDQGDQARSMVAGGVAFTMLVAPLVVVRV